MTYKAPRANRAMTAILCFKARWDEYIGYMGSTRMIRSVVMEKPALAYQFLVMSRHVPATLLFQALDIGMH